jgi:hypothetical protein
MIYYAIENYLAGADALISTSSEDALYVKEHLYNVRPSKPFRFTGVGAAGAPEWICVEFDAPKRVTILGVFNHNFDLTGSGSELSIKGSDTGCDESVTDWDAPDYEHEISDRIVANWNDLYERLDETRLAFRLDVIDPDNEDNVEIGELFLGLASELSAARLAPGRAESPTLFRSFNATWFGQHWIEGLSASLSMELRISNQNDPSQVDALRTMVLAIHAAGSKFLVVPNDRHPFVYYVALENGDQFMAQIARGLECEQSEWTLQLRTLTKGIALL